MLLCSKQGIKIRALCNNRTEYIYVILQAEQFEKYYCERESLEVGIDLGKFNKIIKTIGNNHTLRMYITKNDENKLHIEYSCKEEKVSNRAVINIIDLDHNETVLPAITYSSVITMPSNRLEDICKYIGLYNDKVNIECSGNQLIFRGCDEDTCLETRITQAEGGIKFTNQENPDDIYSSIFKLKPITVFSKCKNFSNTVDIHLKQDKPILLSSNIANIGKIRFVLGEFINDV